MQVTLRLLYGKWLPARAMCLAPHTLSLHSASSRPSTPESTSKLTVAQFQDLKTSRPVDRTCTSNDVTPHSGAHDFQAKNRELTLLPSSAEAIIYMPSCQLRSKQRKTRPESDDNNTKHSRTRPVQTSVAPWPLESKLQLLNMTHRQHLETTPTSFAYLIP